MGVKSLGSLSLEFSGLRAASTIRLLRVLSCARGRHGLTGVPGGIREQPKRVRIIIGA